MQFSLKVEGIKDIDKELKKYSNNVRNGVAREVLNTVNNIRNEAMSNAATDTGKLKQSIIGTTSGNIGEVYVGSKYAADVEKGQKPGKWPNVEDLRLWVKRKIKPSRKKLDSVTFLVRRKIYQKGTKAQPFFEPAVKKYEKRFIKNIEKLLKK